MFCRECGSEIPSGAVACPVCRADAPEGQSNPKPVRRSIRSSLLIFSISFVIGLVLSVSVIMVISDDDDPHRSYTVGNMTVYGDLTRAPMIVEDGRLICIDSGIVTWNYKKLSDTAYVDQGTIYAERGYSVCTTYMLVLPSSGTYDVYLHTYNMGSFHGKVVFEGSIAKNHSLKANSGWLDAFLPDVPSLPII